MTRLALIATIATFALNGVGAAEDEGAGDARGAARAVHAQLRQAEEHLALGEPDAALAKYEQLLGRHGKGPLRFAIRLRLARLHYEQGQFEKAMEHFARAAADASGRGEQNPDGAERVEALFHVGMCYVRLGQHERCFPSFRQVIDLAPGSDLANQAYFQIAEAHYAKGTFTQAIANYALVGTSLVDDALASLRCELGKPLFIRIQDQDFLVGEGKPVHVAVTTSDGDREQVALRPLRPGSDTWVGSVSTGLGVASPDDGVIQATGASTVAIEHLDRHTADGVLDVARSARLTVVADARAAITDGAFLDPISQVIADDGVGQLNLRVVDFDRDSGDAADAVEVELVVERPLREDDLAKDEDKEQRWEERSRAAATLTESVVAQRRTGAPEQAEPVAAPGAGGGVRTGVFTAMRAIAADGRDGAISAAIGDRITVVYRDARHLGGDAPAPREASAVVVPGSASSLGTSGDDLDDPNQIVRKALTHADISLALGEVYRDMGLEAHAQKRFEEALESCRRIGQVKGTYDRDLHERTLHALWRIYLAKGALDEAARACQTLQLEFPDSDYIADSLLAMAKVAEAAGQPHQAVQIYQQIAALPKGSVLAPEALYRVGLVYERQIVRLVNGSTQKDPGMRQQAINAFRKVFSAFPDSTYAGDALKKIGEYYLDDGNANQAVDFFEQILREHPDAPFLADVLYNLGVARGLRGDDAGALSALARLEREFPGFDRMDRARKIRDGLEKRLAGKSGAKSRAAASADRSTTPSPSSP